MNVNTEKRTAVRAFSPFTLIEMLAVISIILIIIGISTVSIAPLLRGRDLRNGAIAIQSIMRLARSEAAHRRQNITVRFEHDGAEGLIEIGRDTAGGFERIHEPRYLPVNIGFYGADPPDPITFTPMGSLADGLTREITVTNGGRILITVIGANGQARVGDVVE